MMQGSLHRESTSTRRRGRQPIEVVAIGLRLERLFPKRGRAPYTTGERVVVLVITYGFDATANAFNCFLSYPTIAKWSGTSLASVKRALQSHFDGPAPLIARSKPGHTRGHRHACYRFTLVRYPERFAVARDAARFRHREHLDQALRDLQPDRIALQRQRQDFGGTLTEAEYARRLKDLEMAADERAPRAPDSSPRHRHEAEGRTRHRAPSQCDRSPPRHGPRVLVGVKLVARLRPALRAHGLDTACARDGLAAIGERPKRFRMDLKTEVSARIDFSRQPNHKPGGGIMKVVVKITPHDHGKLQTKLADAELHFTGGELDGLKFIGFSIWERRANTAERLFPRAAVPDLR